MTTARHEGWLLAATILAASMVFIDGSALNVALPTLQADLGATAGDLLWTVNGYLLVLAALIPLGGVAGDRWGRRRVYMLGIGVFSLGSLLCGLAATTPWLLAARVLQGLGGALLIPGSLALLSAGTDPARRGRAIGTWSAATTVLTVLGPLLGGLFADAGWWRGVFLINPPMGAAALLVLATRVPRDQPPAQPPRLDAAGSLLLTAGLTALTWGALSAPDWGFTSPVVWTAIAAGALALIAFVLVERRAASPVLPLGLFRSATFSGANLLTFFLYGALTVMSFFLSLNLVQVQGYTQVVAGLALLPFALCMMLLSRQAGTWADRWGPRPLLTLGPLLVAVGFVLLALVGQTAGPLWYFATFFPGIAVFGLGMALTVAPLSAAVMSSAGDELSGTASGINNAVSRVAGVLALAVLGAAALLLFPGDFLGRLAPLALSAADRSALSAEAGRLAGVSLPPGLGPELAVAVRGAVHEAFLAVWRVVLLGCAGLALAAAASAWLLVAPAGTVRKKRMEGGPGAG